MINLNPNNIKSPYFVFGFISLMLLFAPGVAYILYFRNDLFVSFDSLKILLLTISLISPFVSINYYIYLAVVDRKNEITIHNKETGLFFGALMFSILVSSLELYLSLFIAYKNKLTFMSTLAIASMLVVIIGIMMEYLERKDTKKKHQ